MTVCSDCRCKVADSVSVCCVCWCKGTDSVTVYSECRCKGTDREREAVVSLGIEEKYCEFLL